MIRLDVTVAGGASPISLNGDMLSVGHSLSDETWEMVLSFMRDEGDGSGTFQRQSIPGMTLDGNWERRFDQFQPSGPLLSTPEAVNGLVLTESVHFRHVQGQNYDRATNTFSELGNRIDNPCDPRGWVDYYNLAAANGVDAVYVYENWSDIRSGTPQNVDMDDPVDPFIDMLWRDRIDAFLPFNQEFVTMLRPGPERGVHAALAGATPFTVTGDTPVYLIPGGQAMARVFDDIAGNNLPAGVSFTDFYSDFFIDFIHPSIAGRYLVACVWYAVMFRLSPVGLSGTTARAETADFFPTVPAADRAYLQAVAWDVAQNTANTGL